MSGVHGESRPHDDRLVVRVDCPDEVGLIHRITGVLGSRGLNIERNQEFVDSSPPHFFFRAEVTAAGSAKDVSTAPGPLVDLERELAAALPPGATIRLRWSRRPEVIVFATKEPHCLGELLLLDACGELPGRIVAVASNHPALAPLVERFGVPFYQVPHGRPGEAGSMARHEAGLQELLARHAPELIVLARYMRVLSREFVEAWPQRIVNIHHSFLPAFAGAEPYRQAFERGVKIIGATAHFVTADLDEGPIIAQDVIPVDHGFTAQRMAQAGRDVEKIVLARAVRLVLEDRVFVHGRRTIVFE